MILYKYGMKLRPVSPGAQPKNFIKFEDGGYHLVESGGEIESVGETALVYFHNIVYYDRQLNQWEITDFDLFPLGTEEHPSDDREFAIIFRQFLSDCGTWLHEDIKGAIRRAIEIIESVEE